MPISGICTSSTSVHAHLNVCACMELPTTGLAASCNIAEKATSQGTWNQQQRQRLGEASRQNPVCCFLGNEKVAGSNIVQHVRIDLALSPVFSGDAVARTEEQTSEPTAEVPPVVQLLMRMS